MLGPFIMLGLLIIALFIQFIALEKIGISPRAQNMLSRVFWNIFALAMIFDGAYMQWAEGWSLLATGEIFIGFLVGFATFCNKFTCPEKSSGFSSAD